MKKTQAKYKSRELLGLPVKKFQLFNNQTKVKKPYAEPSQNEWPVEWKKVYFKGYARFPMLNLPKPKLSKKTSLVQALYERRSSRVFSDKPLRLSTLSSLLFFSAGIRSENPSYIANRFYPSGGARYPIELYIISLNSTLAKGVYHYYLKSHSLEKLPEIERFRFNSCFTQPWAAKAGCIILMTANFVRTTVKYGDRGYRHILAESGHIAQNFYLLSTVLGLSCSANASFLDDRLNKLLDIDGINESVIYTLAVGNKKA